MSLQYIDDNLLCDETEEACSQASEDFLNFLTGCGYKASREKAQLCQQSVKYLDLIISEETRAIGPKRIKPILNHPLGFPGGSEVKALPAMRETWVPSLGWEDALEKGKATRSCILENFMDGAVRGVAKSQT